jgi:hypothetical protein
MSSKYDLDEKIEKVKNFKCIDYDELKSLCNQAKEIFLVCVFLMEILIVFFLFQDGK